MQLGFPLFCRAHTIIAQNVCVAAAILLRRNYMPPCTIGSPINKRFFGVMADGIVCVRTR
jgi:hypothetical protein